MLRHEQTTQVSVVDTDSLPTCEVPQPEPAADAGFDDEHKPVGWVLRYCGILKEFYYAHPAHGFCLCGHRLGSG